MLRRTLWAALGGAMLLTGLSNDLLAADRLPASAPVQAVHGVDLAGMDRSVAPGDDFFAYANGGWMKRTEMQAQTSGAPRQLPSRLVLKFGCGRTSYHA